MKVVCKTSNIQVHCMTTAKNSCGIETILTHTLVLNTCNEMSVIIKMYGQMYCYACLYFIQTFSTLITKNRCGITNNIDFHFSVKHTSMKNQLSSPLFINVLLFCLYCIHTVCILHSYYLYIAFILSVYCIHTVCIFHS